jgi:2-octaprenyl-6-methoxyphenol hydroxylase
MCPCYETDVAIVGGGLIGSAAAIALAQGGINVAVIDQIDLQSLLKPTYDGRTLAIAYGSRQILEKWGIWSLIEKQAQPIEEIRVSSPREGSFVHYDAAQLAEHPMGYILEIRHLRTALLQRLQTEKNCQRLIPAMFQGLVQTGNRVRLSLADDRQVHAKLVIGADGRTSGVRQAVGLQSWTWDYGQTAIVCVVNHERPHHSRAFEHFMPQGPLALLPMRGHRSSVVWTLPTAMATAFLHLEDRVFNRELQRYFGNTLGTLAIEGQRWSHPLSGLYCRKWYSGRVVLMGDACHAIHPVAGQGFNLGLRDAAVLVEELLRAHHLQQDLGAETLLRAYQRRRRLDSVTMTAITDGLVRLFSNDLLTLGALRTVGLRVVNRLPVVKRFLTRHAMGMIHYSL